MFDEQVAPALAGCGVLRDGLDRLADLDPTSIANADVLPVLDELMTAQARLAGLVTRMVGQVDSRGLTDHTTALSAAALLRHRYRLDPTAARRLVEHADTSTRLMPAVGAAQVSGTAHPAQADALVAGLDHIPAGTCDEDRKRAAAFLVGQCRVLEPGELRRAATRLIEQLTVISEDGQPPDDTDPDVYAARAVTVSRRDGGLAGTFFLPGDTGARLAAYLTARSAPDSQHHANPADPAGRDTRTQAQRQADALIAAVDHTAGCDREPGPPVPRILLTLDYQRLTAGRSTGTLLDTGHQLPAADLRRLCCQAGLLPAVLDGDSVPLDLGRGRRLFSRHQQQALALRDGGCTFPGCHQPPAACQTHHLDE